MYNSFIVLSVSQLPKTWNTGSPRFMFLMGIIFQATLNLIEDSKKANLIVRTIAEKVFRPMYGVGAAWLDAVCSHFSVAVDGT